MGDVMVIRRMMVVTRTRLSLNGESKQCGDDKNNAVHSEDSCTL